MRPFGCRVIAAFVCLAVCLFPAFARPPIGESAQPTFPEYVNTSGRPLPIIEGGSGQSVRFGDRPWVIQPGERFFSLPWGDSPRFRWGEKSFHYIGSVGGSRFRFFLIEDWGPVDPVRVVTPPKPTSTPKYEIQNRWTRPVQVIDGGSGQPVSFGNDPWLIPPGDRILSHPWTENKRFVIDARPFHFIGTTGSTSGFTFFIVPDHNYEETGCATDWSITFYGVSDEKAFDGPRVPVVTVDKPADKAADLPVSFLHDTRLQGTGLARSFPDGQARHIVVQQWPHDPAGQPTTATVRVVDQPRGRSGPVIPWATAAGPGDLAYRWAFANDGPFTRVSIEKLGPHSLPREIAERLVGKTFSITDSGGSPRLAPTSRHLDIFVGPLDRQDPAVAALLKQGMIKNVAACIQWPR